MDEFSFWSVWRRDLDDRMFADALAALGVLAAVSPKDATLHGTDLEGRLRGILHASMKEDQVVPWRFPGLDQSVRIGQQPSYLYEFSPRAMAQAWLNAVENAEAAPRIEVVGYPEDEPVEPWFLALLQSHPPLRLREAGRGLKAACIGYEGPKIAPQPKWPIRLGYLPGDSGQRFVERARGEGISRDLSQEVKIGRENGNCDVLVYGGPTYRLLDALQQIPGQQKTNLIIACGRPEDGPEDAPCPVSRHLQALTTETQAHGFVFVNPYVSEALIGDALGRLVVDLSRNYPLDSALCEAFTGGERGEAHPIIFLSRQVANLHIEHFLEKMNYRLKRLPEKARAKMETEILQNIRVSANTVRERLGAGPVDFGRVASEHLVDFSEGYHAAIGIAQSMKALDDVEIQEAQKQPRYPRELVFFEKEAGRVTEENRAFIRGVTTDICIWLGPPKEDKQWYIDRIPRPVEDISLEADSWMLTIVLTEPNHIKEPLRQVTNLPRLGTSNVCHFKFEPGKRSSFEGTVSVLHRNRVLQTCTLKGRVVAKESEITKSDAIAFEDVLPVRMRLGDMDYRQPFELSFVQEETTDKRPSLTTVSGTGARIMESKYFDTIIKDINDRLSVIEKSAVEYEGKLDSENNTAALAELARVGSVFYRHLFKDRLEMQEKGPEIAKMERIQIVTAKSEELLPLEFVYDRKIPLDNAKLCPSWEEALTSGACRGGCSADTGQHVCPLGFWGISKVIERHYLAADTRRQGDAFYLQSETTTERRKLEIRGTALVAASTNVKPEELQPVLTACKESLGCELKQAANWDEWVTYVKDFDPSLILAMPHVEGLGTNTSMEISNETLKSANIDETHVCIKNPPTYPLVALLGCDMVGITLDYCTPVSCFRWAGAPVIISTVATVLGTHAAEVSQMLVQGLKPVEGKPLYLGEVIRSIKRQSLKKGRLMPLCIVAFGDADWEII